MTAPRRPHALIVSPHFPPDRGPATHRVLRFVRHLAEAKWDVTVLTLSPEAYRPGTPLDPALADRIPRDVYVVRTSAWRILEAVGEMRGSTGAKPARHARAAREVARAGWTRRVRDACGDLVSLPDRDIGWWPIAVRAGRRILRDRPADVIVSTAPPFTAHLIAASLSRSSGAAWLADFRDPWSRAPWALERRTTSWQGWVHRRLERRTITRATRVTLNTERMRNDFALHYPQAPAGHFVALPNGFDAAVLRAVHAIRPPVDGPLVLTHAGTLYGARDPAVLFRALAVLMRRPGVCAGQLRVQLVGALSPGFDARRLVAELGLADVVSFRTPVAHTEALRLLASSHALLLFQQGTDLQVPAKLYEYVGLRRPVLAVAPAKSAVADVLERTRLGVVVPPDQEQRLVEALAELLTQRASLHERFAPDEDALGQFDGELLGQRFVRLLAETGDVA